MSLKEGTSLKSPWGDNPNQETGTKACSPSPLPPSGGEDKGEGGKCEADPNIVPLELLAKVRNLPFDRLRVNGLGLKLFSFSVRGELAEPQKILLQEAHYLCEFQ